MSVFEVVGFKDSHQMDICGAEQLLIEKSMAKHWWSETHGGWRPGGSWLFQLFVSHSEMGGDFLTTKGENGKWQNKRVHFSPASFFRLSLRERNDLPQSLCGAGWHKRTLCSLTHTFPHRHRVWPQQRWPCATWRMTPPFQLRPLLCASVSHVQRTTAIEKRNLMRCLHSPQPWKL